MLKNGYAEILCNEKKNYNNEEYIKSLETDISNKCNSSKILMPDLQQRHL